MTDDYEPCDGTCGARGCDPTVCPECGTYLGGKDICEACYDQGYRDAHPGDPDCDECGGRGKVFDELTGSSPCRDCWSADIADLFTDTGEAGA